MHKSSALILSVSLLLLSACASLVRPNFTEDVIELRSGEYQLDPMHSFLSFRIDHLGLSKIIGRFNTMNASLDFDPENPQALKLSGTIESTSIDLNNSDLEETLQEDSWFNTAQYPQIRFESTAVNTIDDRTYEVQGQLFMRGTTVPTTIMATFNGGADNILTRKYTIGFSATTSINRSDFGMDSFSAFIGDEIEIELHGEFQRL